MRGLLANQLDLIIVFSASAFDSDHEGIGGTIEREGVANGGPHESALIGSSARSILLFTRDSELSDDGVTLIVSPKSVDPTHAIARVRTGDGSQRGSA